MSSLTAGQKADFADAYDLATSLIDTLTKANAIRESDARTQTIDELTSHQRQIESLGFFEKDDFTLDEQVALNDAAAEIRYVDGRINDTHEVTLMELESDLTTTIQKLSLQEYFGMLQGRWMLARRDFDLPKDIPQDVRDDYSLGLFSLVQGNLNVIAARLKDIKPLACLNADDYNTLTFPALVLRVSNISAGNAISNYVDLQLMKAEAEAEREASTPSIGGMIWSIIGWDSPSDFLKDMFVFAVTGGAGKVFRWVGRLRKAETRLARAARAVDKFFNVEERVQRMERRIVEIRKAAEKIQKLREIARIPAKIFAVFKNLERAEEQVKILKQLGSTVTKDYVRGVVSTLAARATTGQSERVGGSLTNQLAYQSAMEAIKGWPISKTIDELRDRSNFAVVILHGFNTEALEKFMQYFWLLVARDFLVRWGIATFRKQALTVDLAVNEFIAAFGAALDAAFLDLPLLSGEDAKWLSRSIINTVRKVLVTLGQQLAKGLLS